MIRPVDLLRLPYTPDLTLAGIAYACRFLALATASLEHRPAETLRSLVAAKAADLAFLRHLQAEAVPYGRLETAPFTEPGHYDLTLGGWRCNLIVSLILQKNLIRRLRQRPEALLEARAVAPAQTETTGNHDLYLFAFVFGTVTSKRLELRQALASGQPVWLCYPLPTAWRRPMVWASLGRLCLACEDGAALTVELGGQAADRSFQAEDVQLLPGRTSCTERDFFALAYLHPASWPEKRLYLVSPRLRQGHLIRSSDWVNLWIYGIEIILIGWMPQREFLSRACRLPSGKVARPAMGGLALPLADLYPLDELLAQVRNLRTTRHGRDKP